MKTPDLTPATLAALAIGLANNLYVILGLDLTDAQKGAISGIITTTLTVAVIAHDAFVRRGRAKVEQARVESEQLSVNLGPPAHEAEPLSPAP